MLIPILLIQKKEKFMINLVLKKIDNLDLDHKDNIDRDTLKMINFKIYLEHFLETLEVQVHIATTNFNSYYFIIQLYF
jgi:hypothetical protein